MQYRRARVPGGSFFFTLVTHDRHPWLADPEVARTLGDVMRRVRAERPFETLAMVLMPDHLHCIWRLPPEDADFSTRWLLIKQFMTHRLSGRMAKRPLWQARFWEHCLRDERDVAQHIDYIHFNPVKHGYVKQVCEWPYSSFHKHVASGIYPANWGVSASVSTLPDVGE
jgi:putative transposase